MELRDHKEHQVLMDLRGIKDLKDHKVEKE